IAQEPPSLPSKNAPFNRRRLGEIEAEDPIFTAIRTPAIPNAGAALFRLFRFELFFARAIGVLP
ncbi:MAG: hypothetical protein WAL37_07540, partial [Xanthobacteraceae bacterium]